MLGLKIDSEGRSPVNSLEYQVDGHPIRPKTAFDRPITILQEDVKLPPLDPGPHRFIAIAGNQLGIPRTVSLDIFVRGRPRPQPTRLKVLAIAPAFKHNDVPPIPFAERDIKDLRVFFAQHLVAPGGGPLKPLDDNLLVGPLATVGEVEKSFKALQIQDLSQGDLVVVVIESHFLNTGRVRMISAADGGGIPPFPGIPANELAMQLGEVAKYKCKVLVLLDVLHADWSKVQGRRAWYNDFNDWVRELRDDHNVITFVASNSGPSQHVTDRGHRAFAQAVLDSVRQPSLKDGPYLLDDFRDLVIEGVLNLTGRQQQAACYVPGGITGQFPILNPRPARR
jgi:hypothetical protein